MEVKNLDLILKEQVTEYRDVKSLVTLNTNTKKKSGYLLI